MDGRLTMAAGGTLVPGVGEGRRENVDAATAEKLARLVEQDDPRALEPQALGMIISAAKLARRQCGHADQELTLEDVQVWLLWRQMHPHEGIPPDPEPELLEAKFRIKLGYGGKPVDVAAAAGTSHFDEEFHVVVCDDTSEGGIDQPRSVTVWRLGGAADADTAVSSGVLHGCRAVRCSHPRPPGAFQLELANMPANIPEGQEGSGSFYFLPIGNQSSEELVAFFNRCGQEPPRPSSSSSAEAGGSQPQPPAPAEVTAAAAGSVRHTWSEATLATGGATGTVRALRNFEAQPQLSATAADDAIVPAVLSTRITGTEDIEDTLKGGKVTHYLVECTPLGAAAAPWVLRKRYSHFDEFRKELEIADSSSEVDTLGLKSVPFPSKTWGISSVGSGTVEQRVQKLEEWLNKIIGLNNALLCSDHRELSDAVTRFLRPPQTDMPLTTDQMLFATSPQSVSDAILQEHEAGAATEGAWRSDQITGTDGYLQTFEDQLFLEPRRPGEAAGAAAGTAGVSDDGTDRIVLELDQALKGSNKSGKPVGDKDGARLVKGVQAELTHRDETISQLQLQVMYVSCPVRGPCMNAADTQAYHTRRSVPSHYSYTHAYALTDSRCAVRVCSATRCIARRKLQKQVDGAAALAEDNAFQLLAALGKSEQAQALQMSLKDWAGSQRGVTPL